MFRLLCFLCLIFPCLCHEPLLVDQLRWDFLEMEDQMWNMSSNGLMHQSPEEAESYLVWIYYDFDKKFEQIPQNLSYGVAPHKTIPMFLSIHSELKKIESMYQEFKQYQHLRLEGNNDTAILHDIIYNITNNNTGLQRSIDRIFELYNVKGKGMKQKLYQMVTASDYFCKITQQSAHQMFYNLYNLIALNDLKAFMMLQFAYLVDQIWEKGNNVGLSISTRESYESRVMNLTSGLANAAKHSQTIRRCDPQKFSKGYNYDEFTRLIQGQVMNEADMSDSCTGTCKDFSYNRYNARCYDSSSNFCSRTERCHGIIRHCFYKEASGYICPSVSRERKYEFIKFDKSGSSYGTYGACSRYKASFDWWRRGFVDCDYCMCLCEEEGPNSDRYISLRAVRADVKSNSVVTGLRLVKYNRILHLQIQEGKLLPYGYIDETTVHWVKVDNYKITNSREGVDYFKMTYANRAMAMNVMHTKERNHVVTGVRFVLANSKIYFSIYASPFNYTTGEVDPKGTYYISKSNEYKRATIEVTDSNIPIKTKSQSQVSSYDKYVEFTHTSFWMDVAQTTIPFIDTQIVTNKPAVPLRSAGIYFKNSPGYGGFIAPIINTYNYGPHVSSEMPKMSDRKPVELN